jgi:hypothetical protein
MDDEKKSQSAQAMTSLSLRATCAAKRHQDISIQSNALHAVKDRLSLVHSTKEESIPHLVYMR